MKKIFISLTILATFIGGIIFTGSRLSIQKHEADQAQVRLAKLDLKAVQKAATPEEWIAFKNKSELKIRDHENRFAELNVKINEPGVIIDAFYKKKIANLEEQNEYMKARLLAFENSQSNWESFRTGYNHEMDTIENALKDLTVAD
jgi:chromosome segregation ATPase